jgi:hypothetical protein
MADSTVDLDRKSDRGGSAVMADARPARPVFSEMVRRMGRLQRIALPLTPSAIHLDNPVKP